MATPAPSLNAIPGESYTQYEARLGKTPGAPDSGAGFGTPAPTLPTTPTAPGLATPTPATSAPSGVDANGNPLKTTAEIQSEANTMAGMPLPPSVPTKGTSTDSSSLETGLQTYLSGLGARPVAPSAVTTQANAEAQVGVAGIQQNLTTLNDQYTKLSNDLQNQQAGEASKPGVVATIINGRMKMLSAQDSKAFNDLKLQISDATKQLTQANTAVQTIMKNTQTDYTNASAAYDKAYTEAITVYQDAQSQADKAGTAAKANAQVIINSYKGSSIGINSITPDMEAQWGTLEAQAGMPPGTIKAAITAELNIQKFVKGSDGNMYVTGTDANGVPYTAQVVGSQGAGSGAGGSGSSNISTILAGIGLPLTISDAKGNITKGSLDKVVAAGVPLAVANGIWSNIADGATLDEIRKGMEAQSAGSSKYLDLFMPALQKKATTNSSTIPGISL